MTSKVINHSYLDTNIRYKNCLRKYSKVVIQEIYILEYICKRKLKGQLLFLYEVYSNLYYTPVKVGRWKHFVIHQYNTKFAPPKWKIIALLRKEKC